MKKQLLTKVKELDRILLSYPCKSIILGTLLGDGSLKIYGLSKNARLSIRHSYVQKEYFYWKVLQLKEILTDKSVQIQVPSGFSKHKKLLVQSKSLLDLTIIHKHLYKYNKLKIKRKWLNKLTPLSLMVWWLDDGSIIKNGRNGVFCTDNFELSELKLIQRYFKIVWKIDIKISPIYKNYKESQFKYYRLYLNTTNLTKFLIIILPYIPIKEMLYKVYINYKDPVFQQRWISQMKELLPQFIEEIEELHNKMRE